MLSRKIPRGPGALIAALATVLGVSLAAFFALIAPTTPPAGAITGGQNSETLNGQVQFYVTAGPQLGAPDDYQCVGTLISTTWVLTAAHCITNNGATIANSGVLVGSTQIGQGTPHRLAAIHLEQNTDSALLQLQDPVAQPNLVVGYNDFGVPAVGTDVLIRGWGSPAGQPPQQNLQVATMRTIDTRAPYAPGGDRLVFQDIGQGRTDLGDSGAGITTANTDRIYGILSRGGGTGLATAVPTEDIAGWIQRTSGVAPSSAAPDTSASAGAGAEEEPTEEEPTEEEPTEEEPTEEEPTEEEPTEETAPEEPEQEQPAPLEDGELEALFYGIDASLDGDEFAKELVGKLGERYPGYNVMAIQQETYDEPENIQGVVVDSEDVGILPDPWSPSVNQWDLWVFESGTFTNTGDLGYNNWVFSGNFERSGDNGETVTFEPIEE